MNKKKISKDKGNNHPAEVADGSPDPSHHVESTHVEGVHDKYVITVSLKPPESHAVMHTTTCETVCEDNPSEKNKQPSVHTMSSVNRNITNENLASMNRDISSSSGISAKASQDCPSSSDVKSDSNDMTRPINTADAKTGSETNRNTLLFCSICGMLFRGVSSLRYHMRKVHKKTVEQSDLPSLSGSSTQNLKHQAKSDTQLQTVNQNSENSKEEAANMRKTSENGAVKVVVFDDSKKCVDEPQKLNLSHVCPMCTERFSSKMSLDEHLKSHSEDDVESVGLHRCDTCTSVMKNTQQVTKHIIKVHGVKQIYVCSICNREFYQQSSVYRHMKFLHKWEIKIRGEASIPVFVKPAPLSMQAPIKNTAGVTVRRDSSSEDTNSPTAKLNSNADNVTYISLEIGGTENLQVYKEDGQEVAFEVVDCNGSMTTLKIQGYNSEIEIEDTVLEVIQKSLNGSPETETVISTKNEQFTSIQEVRLASGEAKIVSDTTGVAAEVEDNVHAKTSEGSSNSFILVDDDKSTEFSVSKELISHLFAALKNNAQEKKAHSVETPQVNRVKNVRHTLSSSEPDAVGVDGDVNQSMASKNTLETNEAVPPKASARLPDPASLKHPIIMSVKDIDTTYTKCGTRIEHKNVSETNGAVPSTEENTNMKVISALKATENVNNNKAQKFLSLTKIETALGHDPLDLEETGKNVEHSELTTNFSGKINERVDGVKLEQEFSQSSESEVLINKKDETFVSSRSGRESPRTRSSIPAARTQSKHCIKESVGVDMDKSDKTKKQKHRNKSLKQEVAETSDTSHIISLPQPTRVEGNNITGVPAKVKGSRSSVPKSTFVTKHAMQSAPSCTRTSTFGDMPHLTVDKDMKHVPVMKASEDSDKMEPVSVRRSSSGRIIKRKRFDDEI